MTQLRTGDIGCVVKLRSTHTSDTLSTREYPLRLPVITCAEPMIRCAVRATVPQSQLHVYATTLHSCTHGSGLFARRFHGYEQVLADAAHKATTEHAMEVEEMTA